MNEFEAVLRKAADLHNDASIEEVIDEVLFKLSFYKNFADVQRRQIDVLSMALKQLQETCDAMKAALDDIAKGDYSDPFCKRTPEQRARDALAQIKGDEND